MFHNRPKDCKERKEICDIQDLVEYWRGYLQAVKDFENLPARDLMKIGERGLRKALEKAEKEKEKDKKE